MPYDLAELLDTYPPPCKDCPNHVTLLVKKVSFDGDSYYAKMYQCPTCKDISFAEDD